MGEDKNKDNCLIGNHFIGIASDGFDLHDFVHTYDDLNEIYKLGMKMTCKFKFCPHCGIIVNGGE